MDMFNSMNEVYGEKDIEVMARYAKKVDPHLSAVLAVIKESALSDENLFNAIFVMNFCETKKLKIISKHLGIDLIGLQVAKAKAEIVRFAANIMTHESMAQVYKTVGLLCGLSRKEFVVAWMMLSRSGELIDILFSKEHNPDDLSKDAAALYKRKDEKFNIEDIMYPEEEVEDEG